MRLISLLFCYFIYVNENYYIFVCEPNPEVDQPLVEVIEGEGYREKEPVTYEQVNEAMFRLFQD